MKVADEALYRAKQRGGDEIFAFTAEGRPPNDGRARGADSTLGA